MKPHYTWKVGAPAGFGVMSMGLLMSKFALKNGYHVFDYAEYPSLIQGGHNTYEVVWSEEAVTATKKTVDVLICLTKDTYNRHKARLTDESIVLYDPDDGECDAKNAFAVPFSKLLTEGEGLKIMLNTVALGASIATLGGELSVLLPLLRDDKNKALAKAGYEYVTTHFKEKCRQLFQGNTNEEQTLLSGNEAFSVGAIAADCRFYAAYPMTPTSAVLTTLASWQQNTGMVVRHAEDEVGVINEALGASFGGVRVAVGTSGGGFALMTEAISYAGIAEIPIVVLLGQRPGPATGMPTWTEQGDLLFATFSGHGEFPKILLAPGDIEETIRLTKVAFNLADRYQVPVIMLTDKLLAESHMNISLGAIKNIESIPLSYRKNATSTDNYKRYYITKDGISPLLIPGTKNAFYQANSYEHTEDGHTSEEAQNRIDQADKRNRKQQTYLTNDFCAPQFFGDSKNAKLILYGWGSTKGAALEAQKVLSQKNIAVAYIHFSHLYPLDENKILPLFPNSIPTLLIENNAQGQFGKLLAMETGIKPTHSLLKYDGRPIFVEEIVQKVITLING